MLPDNGGNKQSGSLDEHIEAAMKRAMDEWFKSTRDDLVHEMNVRRKPLSPPVEWHHILDGLYHSIMWTRITGKLGSRLWQIVAIGMIVLITIGAADNIKDFWAFISKTTGLPK